MSNHPYHGITTASRRPAAARTPTFATPVAAACVSLCTALAVTLGGCATPPAAWGERLRAENRIYHVDERADRPLVYHDNERAGPHTLVLLHGLVGSKAAFMELAPRLGADQRVINIDLLGHGDSCKSLALDYSTAGQARVVAQFLIDRDLREVVLIGSSYGGSIALETALALRRVGQAGRVRGVVAIGPPALYFGKPRGMRRVDDPFVNFWVRHIQARGDLARAIMRGSYADDAKIRDEQVLEYSRPYVENPAALLAVSRAAAELFEELRHRNDPARHFAQVQEPVLLIWGRGDRIVPLSVMFQLHALLPRASWALLEGCGHTPQEECPDETERLIRGFLAELSNR